MLRIRMIDGSGCGTCCISVVDRGSREGAVTRNSCRQDEYYHLWIIYMHTGVRLLRIIQHFFMKYTIHWYPFDPKYSVCLYINIEYKRPYISQLSGK